VKRVILVAAVARNRVIGRGADIPWTIPGEQRLFKEVTLGHTLVMGRTTFESIGRPLPGRETIVLTRSPDWSHEGVRTARSLVDALGQAALLPGEVVVVGGAQVYAEALPMASEQILSEIPLEPEGDVLYPAFSDSEWVETDREVFDGFERVWWSRVER